MNPGLLAPGNLDSTVHVCVCAHVRNIRVACGWRDEGRKDSFSFYSLLIFADRQHVRSNLYFFRIFGYRKGREKGHSNISQILSKQKSREDIVFFFQSNKF